MEQDGGTDDVSRFLFCSRSFFTVGRVQHGFSFDGFSKCMSESVCPGDGSSVLVNLAVSVSVGFGCGCD